MATFTRQQNLDTVFGDRLVRFIDVAMDASYVTGGEIPTLAELGLSTRVDLAVIDHGASGYMFRFNRTTRGLMAFYGNYDAADGPLIEVPNGTNLSAVTDVRLMVIGK